MQKSLLVFSIVSCLETMLSLSTESLFQPSSRTYANCHACISQVA